MVVVEIKISTLKERKAIIASGSSPKVKAQELRQLNERVERRIALRKKYKKQK